MREASPDFKVNKDLMFLIREGLNKAGKHRGFLILIWALFNIPTNLFTYFRLEPYMSQTGTSAARGDIMFMMTLLSILGYIPMIAIALVIREDSDEYNGIIIESFKRIPLYITTTLSMIIRLFLPVIVFSVPLLLLTTALASAGIGDNSILFLTIPAFILIFLFFFLRYYSAGMFYLMRDVRNFKAVRYSSLLFRSNWKLMIRMLGICSLIPLALNYAALFLVDDSLTYMLISLTVGAYMYVANAVFADLFLYLGEQDL